MQILWILNVVTEETFSTIPKKRKWHIQRVLTKMLSAVQLGLLQQGLCKISLCFLQTCSIQKLI